MKKIFKYFGVFLSVVLMGAFVTSCLDDMMLLHDAEGGGQLGIKVFFPTKVVAGQPMTINGYGLKDATEIVFPDGITVKDFEVVSAEMIRVNAPAGISPAGGKLIVRAGSDQAESRLPMTLGKTVVSGYSKQPGEAIQGGEQLTVYGEDLEFISKVELLDVDGNTLVIPEADFYRKGTSSMIFTIPKFNIFTGTFVGKMYTYDGREFLLPEIAYEPAPKGGGHWETVKTVIWTNDGSHGEISWDGTYRFAPESNSTGEEIYTVPQAIWDQMKTGTFYMTAKGSDWIQMRITTGWWTEPHYTGSDDVCTGNERIIDNGDGTFNFELNFDGWSTAALLDEQHLLFTGSGYTPLELYFAEEIWVDDGGGTEIVEEAFWENDGSKGAVSWSGDYRFGLDGHDFNGECICTFPEEIWNIIKGETFFLKVKDEGKMQVRITNGWWDTNWGDDIFAGGDNVTDNGDGTYTIEINIADSALAGTIDEKHFLVTGSGFTPLSMFLKKEVPVGPVKEKHVLWENDGSKGSISWNGDYRFGLDGHDGNNECIATFAEDAWNLIKTKTFYVTVKDDGKMQIRVTNGWWDTNWFADDLFAGNELITDNGDGTYELEVNLADTALVGTIDEKHLLLTGSGYTPLKIYYY